MDKKRYKLGVIDLYSIAKNETEIESTPVIFVTLRYEVDKDKLSVALGEAHTHFPLFGTTLEYKGGYSLVENDGNLPIIDCPFDERPKYFGKDTGGYLYRICVCGREFAFEWSRILTDEYGARDFLLAVLSSYFDEPIKAPDERAVDVFLESLNEKVDGGAAAKGGASSNEQPKVSEKKDYSKIKNTHAATRKNPHRANLYTLRAPVSEICAASDRENASLESVIIPIFSNILHRRVVEVDGISITADVTFDCRKAELYSMHNFTVSKILSYSGILGKTDARRVMEVYEKMLTSAKDSIKEEAKRTVSAVKPLVNLRPRILADLASLVVSKAVKSERSDISFINLGKIELAGKAKKEILTLELCEISESADTGISVLELDGEAIITITENYVDKMVVSDFVGVAKMLGINFEVKPGVDFSQSRLKLK